MRSILYLLYIVYLKKESVSTLNLQKSEAALEKAGFQNLQFETSCFICPLSGKTPKHKSKDDKNVKIFRLSE